MKLFIISIATEPVLTFGLLLLIILFVPLFFQRFKLPGIVGLLIAGAIVSPNGLGIIEAAGVIDVLGKVGLLYLMFLAGLEINLDRFKKNRSNTIVFGTLTFLIPQVLGTIIFQWLGYSWPASILIASMFASHTLVSYSIVSRLGLMKENSVSTAVGGTILTDTAALLVLAIVARNVEGELSWQFWISFVGLFILYLLFMFYILPRISYLFFRSIGEKGRFTYVYVIGMMLMCAWVAEVIGIEAIVGAFLAGLAFNRLLSNKGPLKNRVEFFGDAFFIPLFLIYVGMLVDFKVLLSSVDVWIVMVAMTITVNVTKWLAAFSSSWILGFNNDQAWVIFGLSNSQAAATLAAVFVGLELAIFGDEVLNGAIMMILVTCIISALVVEKHGKRLIDDTTREVETDQIANQRILVPLANPQTSARLIEFASNLKVKDNVGIYPLAVVNTFHEFKAQQERARKILDMAAGQVHAINCHAVPVMETNLNIAEGISLSIEKHAITDVVIGWNGKITTTSRVFGSILDQILNTTRQQVFVCKLDQPVSNFSKVKLVLSPGSISSPAFLSMFNSIINFAENLNSTVEICHTSNELGYLERLMKLIASKDVSLKLTEYDTFERLIEEVVKHTSEHELLMLINQRGRDYGWAYGVNLVPRLLARQNPDLSFVIAYPLNKDEPTYQTDLIFSN